MSESAIEWSVFAFSLILSRNSQEEEVEVFFSRSVSDYSMTAPPDDRLRVTTWFQGYGGKVPGMLLPKFLEVCSRHADAVRFGRGGRFDKPHFNLILGNHGLPTIE